MISIDPTTALALALAVIAVAAVALGLVATVASRFFVANRRTRLARHESFRSYYRGLVVSH